MSGKGREFNLGKGVGTLVIVINCDAYSSIICMCLCILFTDDNYSNHPYFSFKIDRLIMFSILWVGMFISDLDLHSRLHATIFKLKTDRLMHHNTILYS